MTGKVVLPEKDLLEKAATIKRFEYSPLCSELKKTNWLPKDEYKFKNQIKVRNNNREKDESDEVNKSD